MRVCAVMADSNTQPLRVEQARAELREMFPRYKYFFLSVSVGAPRMAYEIKIGPAFYSTGVRAFYGETLDEAMDLVRRYKQEHG